MNLSQWTVIYHNGLRVSRKLIVAKPKYFYKAKLDESKRSLFVTSNGRVNNFMCHNSFSLHCKTIHQDPQQLTGKLILYIWHARGF